MLRMTKGGLYICRKYEWSGLVTVYSKQKTTLDFDFGLERRLLILCIHVFCMLAPESVDVGDATHL